MLPVLNIAKQRITIPYVGKVYNIRPYLVGEEKALLMALESKDQDIIISAIKNLIQSCVSEKINIDEMSNFETEYLFVQLRKISVNNIANIGVRHKEETDCKHVQNVSIDLDDMKFNGAIDSKIILDEEQSIGVIMKVPTNKILAKVYPTETEKVFGLIQDCIASIFDAESVYDVKETSPEELRDWINTLNNAQVKKIAEFFSNLPSFHFDIRYTCEKCGVTEEIKVEGLNNFL